MAVIVIDFVVILFEQYSAALLWYEESENIVAYENCLTVQGDEKFVAVYFKSSLLFRLHLS